MKHMLFGVLLVVFALMNHAFAQSQTKAQVMILGVYHFENPNQDYVKSNLDDHLSEKRQQQIAEVLDLLGKFNPTKIVLEAPPEAVKVQQNYVAFLKGEYNLTASESHQLGYRLAKQFNHKLVYLADHRIGMDIEAVMAAARKNGDKVFLETFQKVIAEVTDLQKKQNTMTVRESLLIYNDPKLLDRARDFYLQLARIRDGEKFVGADVLSDWYKRNFRIFTNINQIVTSPEDRVLVIFGQGHAPILREMARSCADMQLVEPNDYLKR